MTHGSLFSGIGGFDLAAQWAGIENKWQVEWDKYCQKVLQKNFPDVKKYHDITKVNGGDLETVDIISGGFPCQPFSQAGEQKGKDDDRYLWPEMLRIIKEVKPKYIIGENVAGIINMELDQVLSDLEISGYTCETFIIPACGVGAWHRRNRVWVFAYTKCSSSGMHARTSLGKKGELQERIKQFQPRTKTRDLCTDVSDSDSKRLQGCNRQGHEGGRDKQSTRSNQIADQWAVESDVGRVANGVPSKVDRLKGLGNAIVPQIAYILFCAIKDLTFRSGVV